MQLTKIKIYILFLLSCMLLQACSHDEFMVYEGNTETRNVGDYIGNNFDLSLFHAALLKTDLLKAVTGTEKVTVYAPTNAAFNAIGIYRASDFDKLNQDSLKTMIQYHILAKILPSEEIPVKTLDAKYPNMAGKDLIISKHAGTSQWDKTRVFVNGAEAIRIDIALTNGILNIVNACFKYQEGNVQHFLSKRPEYSVFVAGLKKFGYWEQLAQGEWSVVAPDNQAFDKAGITLDSISRMDPGKFYKRFMGVYLFDTRIFLTDLELSGQSLATSIEGDVRMSRKIFYNVDIRWFAVQTQEAGQYGRFTPLSANNKVNYLTDNGTIHHIEQLLFLPDEAVLTNTGN
ncbi:MULTISPECIES: fasciclin domain-containing protein [Sphingobacterium]|uniref:fasciclin domain-containing protein n=1 Tax=Sphingobacterium TaxID=28453 RepID=UPI0025809842|nr:MULTISPECIES: fasciclin domain-containing protein [Sphingobacterium]